jgi:hypothetical protein
LDYHDLIKARLATVLKQNQVECNNILSMMDTYAVDTIILATAILSCTELQAVLRFAQNGLTIAAAGVPNASCLLRGPPAAARLIHVVRCGALWVFLMSNAQDLFGIARTRIVGNFCLARLIPIPSMQLNCVWPGTPFKLGSMLDVMVSMGLRDVCPGFVRCAVVLGSLARLPVLCTTLPMYRLAFFPRFAPA